MVDSLTSTPVENSAIAPAEGAKRGRTRDTIERERHLSKLADLYCKGKRQHEMAEELGCSQQQVSYDLGVLRRYWKQTALVNVNEAKLRELAKIDNLERIYYECFMRSMLPAEKKKIKEAGQKTEKSIEERGQTGDPRWGERIEWCINKRCELLGLNKASQDSAEGMQALAAAIASHYTDMTNATLGQDADGDAVSDSTQCPDATMDAAAGG